MHDSLICAPFRASIGIAAVGAVWLALLATPAGAAVPDPVVTGPIAATATPGDPSHDYIFFASLLDLAGRGYVEEEYFISGTANRYLTPGTSTGTVLDSNHPYKTRIVVRRPASADDFNGVVIVEWLNVTNLLDMENTWFQIDEHLLRSGYAWVGVSAQRDGVNRLRTWSPSRYGTLDVSQRNASGVETITNDALSYDVLSQAAQAVRSPVGVDPLGGLEPQVVIATGHSQSAMRLVTYVNAIQPLAHAFDAFALHGSLGNAVRVDLEVPVWKVLSEFDVNGFNEAQVRRPDDALFRTWEVAGTSHVDRKTYASRVPVELRDTAPPVEDSLNCGVMPPGSAVPFHYVMAAGLEHLVRWVREGTPMPSAPPLETVSIFPTVVLARDSFGNALGGIRLSQMDVPTAVNNGTNTGPGACNRWGYSVALRCADVRDALPELRQLRLAGEQRDRAEPARWLHPGARRGADHRGRDRTARAGASRIAAGRLSAARRAREAARRAHARTHEQLALVVVEEQGTSLHPYGAPVPGAPPRRAQRRGLRGDRARSCRSGAAARSRA